MRRGKLRKFGKVKNKREALYRALATALVDHGKITTTISKAKSLAPFISKIITKAKKGDLAATRLIAQTMGVKATRKLVKEIGPRFKDVTGGYTRIIKIGRRISDSAEMAIIELTK